MSVPVRIGGFAALLGAVFAIATVAGAELDPEVSEPSGHAEEEDMNTHATSTASTSPHEAGSVTSLPGLAVEQGGYRLVPEATTLPAEADSAYAFRIVDAEGQTVRSFDVEHERRMHLIIVRRDFARFQHLHPEQRADGSWVAPADLSEGGVYRAFADFATAGESLTLGTDVFVRGSFEPEPLPEPAHAADAGDGYRVAIESEEGEGRVQFSISRNGREIGAVEPYLGADGHLVALREHDQAFLHVHPEGEPGGRGPISFGIEYPSPGNYRLFLQFKHNGEVRTAAFTQSVGNVAGHARDEEHSDGGH
ncbi:MAG TPA: hypothetical protein VHF58_04600 [Solirubrobacterales bacterium]|nr:hypothetical protein [Solirubrobacterales bacterium]